MRCFFDEHSLEEDSELSPSSSTFDFELPAAQLSQALAALNPKASLLELFGLGSFLDELKFKLAEVRCPDCNASMVTLTELALNLKELGFVQGYFVVLEHKTILEKPDRFTWSEYLEFLDWTSLSRANVILRRSELVALPGTLSDVAGVAGIFRVDASGIDLQERLNKLVQQGSSCELWYFEQLAEKGKRLLNLEHADYCLKCLRGMSSQNYSFILSGSNIPISWEDYLKTPFKGLVNEKPTISGSIADNWRYFEQFIGLAVTFGFADQSLTNRVEELVPKQRFNLFFLGLFLKRLPALNLQVRNALALLPPSEEHWGEGQFLLAKEIGLLSHQTEVLKFKIPKPKCSLQIDLKHSYSLEELSDPNLVLIQNGVVETNATKSILGFLGVEADLLKLVELSILPGNPQRSLDDFKLIKNYCRGGIRASNFPDFYWRGLTAAGFFDLQLMDFNDFGLNPEKFSFIKSLEVLQALGLEQLYLFDSISQMSLREVRRLTLARSLFNAKVHSGRKSKESKLCFYHVLLDWETEDLPHFARLIELLTDRGFVCQVFDNSGRLQ